MNNTKRRGRPKGSKNKPRSEVLELPAACPQCGSTALKVEPGAHLLQRDIAGTLPGGYVYGQVTWQNKRCGCGQLIKVRKYLPRK